MESKSLKYGARGFTLIEVIVTIFIFSIGILAIYRVIPSFVSGTALNSSRVTAAHLSQEGIEIIRNIREGNWLEINSGVAGAAWNKGLLGCSLGCTADYTILGQADPILLDFTQRATSTKLKIDFLGFYKYDCPGCEESKFSRTITIIQETSGRLVNFENNILNNSQDYICGSSEWRAQTFVADSDHNIEGAVFNLYRAAGEGTSPGCRVFVTIRDAPGGVPTGGDLGSQNLDCDLISQTGGRYEFSFSGGGINLSAGQTYALVIRTNGGAGCPAGNRIYYRLQDSNPYPGGAIFISNGGVGWSSPSPYNDWDAYFIVRGRAVGDILNITSGVFWVEKEKVYNFTSKEKIYQW